MLSVKDADDNDNLPHQKTLTKRKKNYVIIEKECLAIKWAISIIRSEENSKLFLITNHCVD